MNPALWYILDRSKPGLSEPSSLTDNSLILDQRLDWDPAQVARTMASQEQSTPTQPPIILPSSQPLSRPHTNVEIEFDSGLNSSTAWTASDAAKRSSNTTPDIAPALLSDDEGDDEPDLESAEGRSARALYAFEGKPEFRELVCVEAGDELEVLKEDVGDGWSLVKLAKCRGGNDHEGEIGLLPQSYYTVNDRPSVTGESVSNISPWYFSVHRGLR